MFHFFNPDADTEKIRGAFLPHWHQDGVLYFVTFRLADSLPQKKLRVLRAEKELWLKENPQPHSEEQRADYHRRFTETVQRWLDRGYGSMILRDSQAEDVLTETLRHFDQQRYHLDEFVVAANHVHALVSPIEPYSLRKVLHTWKSYTAKELLKLPVAQVLTTAPTVWQQESWDHMVRSEGSLSKFREYIQNHTRL